MRDDVAMRATDLDRLHQQVRALEADNDRLRRDAEQSRTAVAHLERQFARQASELASVYGSRSWQVARLLRRLFRRRALARASAAARLPAPLPADAPGRAPPGVALIVPPVAGDAVARCNAAAAAAAAASEENIVFWDGVSPPQPGWLEALAECFGRFEGAGMAGALLLAPDGRIAAAGASILPDGRLAPLGCGEHPTHPAYASVSVVEALPLGGVMVPAKLWRRFDGLDEDIASPALALADLALRMRRAGLLVLCQPFARLAAGERPAPADAWAEAHASWRLRRRKAGHGNGLASLGLAPPAAPRALFVDNLVPTPDRDSGSGDIHCSMGVFVSLGYEVTLLPVGDLGRADRYVDDLRRRGVRVVANGWAGSAAAFLARERAPFDLIMLHRGSLAGGPLIEQLRAHSPQARVVFNTVDLHFLRLEREALLTRSPETLAEAFRAEQLELGAIVRADRTVLLSPAEQGLVADLLPRARTCVIPIGREIAGRRAPFGRRHGVLFVGGFRHRPNVDAILFFVRDIWPLVRGRVATTLAIVGADTPPEVAALANDAADIVVRGHVEDLEAVLATCRVTVAPLRFGAGIKGKIVSSLAAGVPCVASPIAAEGMGLTDRLNVRIAASPEAFADAVVELHEHEAAWTKLSDAGLEFAVETCSMAGARRRIAALLRDLGLPAGA